MTRPDPHAAFEELAAGFALHALEPEDEQAFLAHLGACARCERDLAEHAAVLAQLAHAPESAEPPPSLLEGIRAGITGGADLTVRHLPQPEPGPTADDETPLEVARRRRDASRLRRAATWTGIAAAFALVVSLGAWNTALRQDREEQQVWGARLAAAVETLRDDATEVVPLEGEAGEVVAVALLNGEEMSLVVDGLPVNDAGTTYVLWGESRYGDKRAVGAFDVTGEGQEVLERMRLQASVDGVTKLMVTHERGEAAPPIPTLPVLASGTV